MNRHDIQVITMGCSKNLVDSEHLLAQLSHAGLRVCHDADRIDAAPIVLINTCGFIGDAKEESIDMILRCIEAKESGRVKKVLVMGCLSERYRDELMQEIPEADAFFGVTDIDQILLYLGVTYNPDLSVSRFLTTPSHYAFLKIAEGCNRGCAFCAIPAIRGGYRSDSIDKLACEAEGLAAMGVKEILLIAQDLTHYGTDLKKEAKLPQLLKRLLQIESFEWIRLHYTYPLGFPFEILRLMRENPRICNYLDIPFQHISNRMLKRMRRGISAEKTLALIDRIRKEVPGICLRTTLLVGFPGETEEDFQELMHFVQTVRFNRLGVFAYSHEENTWAADHYTDDVPDSVKQARVEAIMQLQQTIAASLNAEQVGSTVKVIIDRCDDQFWYGRTEADSPEVDQEVFIAKEDAPHFSIGNFEQVRIEKSGEFELYARPLLHE